MLGWLPATLRFLEFFRFFPTFSAQACLFLNWKCFFHSFCATDLNFGTKNNGGMKYSTLKTVIFASYWGSPLVQFSKLKNFLWACWFLCKNLSNFVPLPWKLHNPYCHNLGHLESIPIRILRHFCWLSVCDFWQLCVGKINVVFSGTCQNKVFILVNIHFLPSELSWS